MQALKIGSDISIFDSLVHIQSITSGNMVKTRFFSTFLICDFKNEVKVAKIQSVLLHLGKFGSNPSIQEIWCT